LLESYERPTASIDAARAATALDSVPNLAELAAGFRAAAYVMGKVDVASDDTSQSTGQRVRLQGAIGLALRCPGNAGDPILLLVPAERRATLVAKRSPQVKATLQWNLVLQGENETVFFDF
jgi:hypothetical protein